MTEPARLTVHPGPPLAGEIRVPGDKSITHRAFLLALMGEGETVVTGANPGADCEATLTAAEALGVAVERGLERLVLRRGALQAPQDVLDCGNSGSTLRMLAGVLAGLPFETTLDGDDSLRRRPVHRVVAPLRAMGATLHARDQDRFPPLTVRGGALRPFRGRLEVASAQVASAITFAAMLAEGESVIEIPGPARDHTERMLAAAGVPLVQEALPDGGRRVSLVGPVTPGLRVVDVPGDASAAAFFLAAAATRPGARVTVRSMGLNPTRSGLLDVLEAMGATVIVTPVDSRGGEPVGDVTVEGGELRAFDIPPRWVPRLVDEVPAWVVLAAHAHGTSRLTGAAELRLKESDRLATLASGLMKLGLAVEEHPEGLAITGGVCRGGSVTSAGDHRIAMTFAVLGTGATGPITIDDTRAIATSFPDFEPTLAALGGRLEPAPRIAGTTK
jgi:3-phosphoshikimate 1-carboxyvinyltransferase